MRLYLTVLLLLACVACTRDPASEIVEVPTLAVLPGVATPEVVRPPTITPTVTLSPVPTVTPTSTPIPLPDCHEILDWWNEVSPTVVRFLDVTEVASATARASLSTVLLEMRQVFREFERLDYPECAALIRNELQAGMQSTVDGFNDFLGESDYLSTVQLENAALHFWSVDYFLLRYSIAPDARLGLIALDWGGRVPNEATATWVYMPASDRLETLESTAAIATEFYARITAEAEATIAAATAFVAPTLTVYAAETSTRAVEVLTEQANDRQATQTHSAEIAATYGVRAIEMTNAYGTRSVEYANVDATLTARAPRR